MGDDAKKLAKDYSNFLNIDIKSDIHSLEESIDETLTRLEEFENVLEMIKVDNTVDRAAEVLSKKEEILALCQKVHHLEWLTDRVKQDVDKVELLVTDAETYVKNTTEGKIRSMLKPFFSKKTEGSGAGPARPVYTPPVIFKTSDLLNTLNTF